MPLEAHDFRVSQIGENEKANLFTFLFADATAKRLGRRGRQIGGIKLGPVDSRSLNTLPYAHHYALDRMEGIAEKAGLVKEQDPQLNSVERRVADMDVMGSNIQALSPFPGPNLLLGRARIGDGDGVSDQ